MGMVDIRTFRLKNATGAYAEVTNYGATLLSLFVPDQSGQLDNVILHYNRMEDYFSDKFYIGSTIGRIANRIAHAKFELNGKIWQLEKNDGNHTNHGGFSGFNSRIFDYQTNDESSAVVTGLTCNPPVQDNKVVFTYKSINGEGGFPGNIFFSVSYSFSENNELFIEYKAVSDMETPFNPTNHAYFNLTGNKVNILNHELKIFAGRYLETDNEYIPSGKILPLSGSAFDFRDYKKLFPAINTYFIGNSDETFRHLASIREFSSGRKLDVYSSMPGIQVYTGDFLTKPFYPFAGIALEAQFYPDFLNQKHFPSSMLYPDTEIKHSILLKFETN